MSNLKSNSNPHQMAHDLTKFQWIWHYHKRPIIGITAFTLIMMVWIAISSPEAWWAYGIVLPAWYGVWTLNWGSLYRKNLKLYHNWEETFGGKMNPKKKE
jgi:hypothetical protein